MDTETFEKLNGMALGLFVADLIKNGTIDEGIFDYYKRHAAALDGPHLEMLISLLGHISTPEALYEVAKHLDHPTNYIRYEAIQTILRTKAIDEKVMEKVVQVLSDPRFSHVALKEVLDRGATDKARQIAEDYRIKSAK